MKAFRSCAAIGLSLAVLVLPAAAAGGAHKLHGNNFFANCRFSHMNHDDPIVFPGHRGLSHDHTYFGNSSTNARSTPASLRGAATTCKPSADKAAYWIPTLYRDGHVIRPAKAQFYYNLRGYDRMRAFPDGLKVVAGDSRARRPQSTTVVYWDCVGAATARSAPAARPPQACASVRLTAPRGFFRRCATCKLQPLPPSSPSAKRFLELHVNFPDCWDGRHLDSRDHRSHMAYSTNYVCPASHPVKVPLIRLTVRYPIDGGRGVYLSSGGVLTAHADFLNAWDERFLTKLVATCFRDRPCNPETIKGG